MRLGKTIHVNLSILVVLFTLALTAADAPLLPGAKPKNEGAMQAGEGPAWHPDSDLYFTGGDRITRRDANGVNHIFREPSGGAGGLLFDLQGRLLACEGRARPSTMEASPSWPIATKANGSIPPTTCPSIPKAESTSAILATEIARTSR